MCVCLHSCIGYDTVDTFVSGKLFQSFMMAGVKGHCLDILCDWIWASCPEFPLLCLVGGGGGGGFRNGISLVLLIRT